MLIMFGDSNGNSFIFGSCQAGAIRDPESTEFEGCPLVFGTTASPIQDRM